MKLIKKINALFLGILFVAGMVFSALSMWSSWENAEVDQLLLSGKTHRQEKKEDPVGSVEPAEQAEQTEPLVLEPDDDSPVKQEELSEKANEQDETAQTDLAHPFTFAVISDAESFNEKTGHNKELEQVLSHASGKRPDFALFTGDIITTSDPKLSGNVNRIKNVKNLIERYFNNYYIAFGKHDIQCGDGCVDAWNEIFFDNPTSADEERKLFYSFDYLNTHFVLLSSDYPEKHSVDRAQLAWLEKDLEQNSLPNTIVVQHVPPVKFFDESAFDCHDLTCVPEVKEKLLAIFRKFEVDCVISGHEHAFDHKIVDGIDFVLSGNTGNKPRYKNVIKGDIYTLFSINGESINLQAINTENEIIREIKIK